MFWKTFSPFFSSKSLHSEKIILIENNDIVTKDESISEILNDHFVNISKSLDIKKWPEPANFTINEDVVSRAIRKYSDHPSIIKIKSMFNQSDKFEFKHIPPEDVAKQIKKLNESKSSRGDIPTKFIKKFSDIYLFSFTDILNNSINDDIFSIKYEVS